MGMRRKEIRKNIKNDNTIRKRTIRSKSGECFCGIRDIEGVISVFYNNSKQEKKEDPARQTGY